jgi:hypothetical protein
MAEQETKEQEGIWTPVPGKPGLEAAKKPIIENSPRVVPEVQNKYRELIAKINAGEIKKEEGQKNIMQQFEMGDHIYGITQFEDSGGFSIWRRKKGAGGSGGGKKPYLRLTGFTVGDENTLNAFLTEHPNADYFLEPITFPEVSSGIQQFVISSKKLIWPAEKESSEKDAETKTA